FRKHAVALQVDDLLGFRQRKRDRIVPAVMGIGAHEAVRFDAFGSVLLDNPGGLVKPVGAVGGGADAIAFILGRGRRRLACFTPYRTNGLYQTAGIIEKDAPEG